MPSETMISYAQNGEDVVLQRAFADQDNGFWIDIGACDPEHDSVTLNLYLRGWRGVNVEPDGSLLARIRSERPRDINVQAAIGSDGTDPLFFPTGTRGHGTLLQTLAKDRVPKDAYTVPALSLASLIDTYVPAGQAVDFLKVDVEGSERAVLISGDWSRHRPRLVIVESVDDIGRATHHDWEHILVSNGYVQSLFDGLNRWYCRTDQTDLISRTEAPANVIDNWILAGHAALAASVLRYEKERARPQNKIRRFWPFGNPDRLASPKE